MTCVIKLSASGFMLFKINNQEGHICVLQVAPLSLEQKFISASPTSYARVSQGFRISAPSAGEVYLGYNFLLLDHYL